MEKKEQKYQDRLISANDTVFHADLLQAPRLTPTGRISHAKTRVYTQRYRKEWEQMPDFKGWLTSVPCQPTRAFCTYCKKNLHAHRLSLLKHTCTMKHQRSALMHQNDLSAMNATTRGKINIEAELEDEPEEGEVRVMDTSVLGQVKMMDQEEDDEEIEYVVERLEMDEEEMEQAQRKCEQEHIDEEEDEDEDDIERESEHFDLSSEIDDVKPPLKKIKIERNNEKCRDTLAEAMAHVHGEYLDENNEQVNVELEMVVESEDTNSQETEVMSIFPNAQNNENDTLTKNIEESDEHSRRSNDESENNKSIDKSSEHEGDSSELNVGNEIVLLRPSSTLNSTYQINSSKSSSPSTLSSQQALCNAVIAPIHNKTITLTSHDGKTLTLMGSKFQPGTQYVLNKVREKIPILVMADKKPIVVSNQSESSQKCIRSKKSRLPQSIASFAVAGTSQQNPKKHVILKSIKPSLKKPRISTHVLDTSKGLPVGGLQVSLYKLMDGRWTFLNESNTTPNGRCNDLVDSNKCNFTAGRYKIHFDVDKYFTLRRIETMYPFIEIVFDVKNSTGHYHIPVLLSPFGYTTYRGSER